MTKNSLAMAVLAALALPLAACGPSQTADTAPAETVAAAPAGNPAAEPAQANPLMAESTLTFGYPRFDLIKDEHFAPALEEGMAQHAKEIAGISGNAEPATFENTIVAMEKAGGLLQRAQRVFMSLAGAHTNDTLQKVQADMAPKLAAHLDVILLDEALFRRIQTLVDSRDTLGLDAEALQLLDRYHTDFVRAGARLSAEDKVKLKDFNAQ